MLEILKFIFSSFWIWLGMVIILGVIAEGIGGFVSTAIKRGMRD